VSAKHGVNALLALLAPHGRNGAASSASLFLAMRLVAGANSNRLFNACIYACSTAAAGTLNGIIDTVSAKHDVNALLALLAPRGRMVVVGLPPDMPTINHLFLMPASMHVRLLPQALVAKQRVI
jgi:D-arabinose 1-dehydrogenase-like Zn-dependent alcohol dehydrogenase